MENDVYCYNQNKKTSATIQVRSNRRIVAIPVPKTGIRTVVEVATHMSNTLKNNIGTHHTPNPLTLLYILLKNKITIFCFSYFLWEAGRPHTPAITGV
jgi:hypothetical protein